MNANRFDTFTKRFATRRLSRRDALTRGGASFAASTLAAAGFATVTSAQESTPAANATCAAAPAMLFLQAFQAGSVVPKEGDAGRYILTLEQGLGQTVYFSDRPDRIVGAQPTPQFLAELGFPDDNPPNATLVVEMGPGRTEVAVLELFAPVYDDTTHTAIYEVAVLAIFERSGGFGETDADLAELLPRFDAAHLFIDDCVSTCPVGVVMCRRDDTNIGSLPGENGICCGYAYNNTCKPSTGWTVVTSRSQTQKNGECNFRFRDCEGACVAVPYCAND